MSNSITVAFGDGIGPEIMEAALFVLREAGAKFSVESVELGSRIYDMESPDGVLPSAWEVLKRHGILLKAPTAQAPGDAKDVTHTILTVMGLTDEHTGSLVAYLHKEDDSELLIADSPMDAEGYFQVASVKSYVNDRFALFETAESAHGDKKGRQKSSPIGMIMAANEMLKFIGQDAIAARIEAALKKTLAEGLFTADLKRLLKRGEKLKTMEFAEALVERL